MRFLWADTVGYGERIVRVHNFWAKEHLSWVTGWVGGYSLREVKLSWSTFLRGGNL